jgi:uncharacterized membrane protein
MKPVQRYLMTGLLVWVPLGITFLILKLIVDLMDQTLVLIPAPWRPENLLGFRVPGLGILLTAAVVFTTGIFAANLVGRSMLRYWDSILQRIPLVRSIYGGAKSFTEVLFSDTGKSFNRVVMIEWPRKGVYAIAFLTGTNIAEARHRIGEDIVSVFVPTTPNPTSGFVLLVPRRDIIELDMDVESAIKLVVSLGVVVPKWTPPVERSALAPPGPPT